MSYRNLFILQHYSIYHLLSSFITIFTFHLCTFRDVTESDNSQFADAGIQILLQYFFRFLEHAWMEKEKGEICSDFLQESFSLLQRIEKPLFFDERNLSNAWTDVFEKSSTFLEKSLLRYVNRYMCRGSK